MFHIWVEDEITKYSVSLYIYFGCSRGGRSHMQIVVLLSRVMPFLLCLHFNDNSLASGTYTYLNDMERTVSI